MWMGRRARCSSQRGLLLVEAVLSAVVIGVGLAFISRSLSGQLKALAAVEDYETLSTLARERLTELEDAALRGLPPPSEASGTFDEPYDSYQWEVAAVPVQGVAGLEDEDSNPLASEVRVTVRRRKGPSPAVQLSAVWPIEWTTPE